MSTWRYRDEAIGHVWEFVTLGYERPEERSILYEEALADHKRLERFIADHEDLILDIVGATPSRRPGMLRRMSRGHGLTECALILGGWQHCRKAVLAYDWLMQRDDEFSPGQSYRAATVSQGLLFADLRARKWTKWPFQWGKSPFPGEKSRRYPSDAPDFNEMMDNYNPETGSY
ncbi:MULTISPECIES: hypothetical protein [Piscinibacter]|uniref:hypothetical protein n=1 Tax=Piscinibacter TaxID=1114981 RepID=UPI000FDE2A7C|nr:hypothetical protein [Piscinibacter defluvii]